MKIMTDFVADQFWMIVAHMEVETVSDFEKMMNEMDGMSEADMKEMEEIMKDYHDLVVSGRRGSKSGLVWSFTAPTCDPGQLPRMTLTPIRNMNPPVILIS